MTDFKNKVAIVTGASQGIGKAVAERLGRDGASVIIDYKGPDDKQNAEAVVASIVAHGGKAVAVQADITVVSEIEHLFKEGIRHFGKPDLAVLNSGVGTLMPLPEMTEAEFDRVFGVNAKGTLFCLKEVAINLNDNGRCVIISSSTTAFPMEGAAIYAGSKATLKMYTEVASRELGVRGITVNAIMPGITLTPMAEKLPAEMKEQVAQTSPFKRLGQPEDIADAVAMLLGPDAHWVTGQVILVNGGGKQ